MEEQQCFLSGKQPRISEAGALAAHPLHPNYPLHKLRTSNQCPTSRHLSPHTSALTWMGNHPNGARLFRGGPTGRQPKFDDDRYTRCIGGGSDRTATGLESRATQEQVGILPSNEHRERLQPLAVLAEMLVLRSFDPVVSQNAPLEGIEFLVHQLDVVLGPGGDLTEVINPLLVQ